jgi:hypothetical protein
MVTKKPSITYEIHSKDGKDSRIVTVEKPTMQYFLVFELIKFRRIPAKFPDLGITVLKVEDE